MGIRFGDPQEYFKVNMRKYFYEYFEAKYPGDWRRQWADVQDNDAYYNSPERYTIIENIYYAPDSNSAAQQIIQKYVDVSIIQVVMKRQNRGETLPDLVYHEVTFTIGVNSPYYVRGNIRQIEMKANFVSDIPRILVENGGYPEDSFEIITIYLKERRTVGYDTFIVTLRLLPTHPAYEYKYFVTFPRRWPTDSIIPRLAEGEYIGFGSDDELDAYLANNFPNEDTWILLDRFARVVADQVGDTLKASNYNLMPLYVTNMPSRNLLLLRRENSKNLPTQKVYPLVLPDFKSLYAKGQYPQATNTWYKEKFDRYTRFEYAIDMLNSFLKRGSIYTVDYDENDIYPEATRDTIYNEFQPAHKFTWLLNQYGDFYVAPQPQDPGNTHTTVKYPINTPKNAVINAVSAETTITYTFKRPLDFKISDIIKNISYTNRKKIVLVTDVLSTTYSTAIFRACDFLFINKHIFAEIKPNFNQNDQIWELIVQNDINFEPQIGEPICVSSGSEEISEEIKVKKIKLDIELDNLPDNSALLYGDDILHIVEYANNEITVIDENGILGADATGAKVEISPYWEASVPGELLENPFIGKKIQFSDNIRPQVPDNVPTLVEKLELWPNNAAEDVGYICQSVFHQYLNDFGFEISINIDDAPVISEYEDDWGVATLSVDNITIG